MSSLRGRLERGSARARSCPGSGGAQLKSIAVPERVEGRTDAPGISVSCCSLSFLPSAHGAPFGIPLSPVWTTNSMSGTASGAVMRASSVAERGSESVEPSRGEEGPF